MARVGLALIACLIGGGFLAPWIGPVPPRLADVANGDETLVARVRETLGADTRGLDTLAVVAVDGDEVRFATFGHREDGAPLDPDTGFEIGSLAKPLTGMLLADLIDAGRVDVRDTLAETTAGRLPLDGPGAEARLLDIARHRTGWPRLPLADYPRVILASYGRRDPYTGEPGDVLRSAAGQTTSRGEYAYSNLGFAALGHALAVHERVDYAELLERRLLTPLGLHDTHVLGEGDPLPAGHVRGRTPSGLAAEPWRADAWQPAGVGIWSTAHDLSRLMTALLGGTAPGLQAIEPVSKIGSRRHVGYGWMIEDVDGTSVTWHNGGTGGFRTWLGLSRTTGRGVAVLSNTGRPVDALGRSLLIDEPASSLDPRSAGWFDRGLALFAVIGTAFPLIVIGRSVRRATGDRHVLVRQVASAVQTLALTRVLVPWDRVSTVPWSVGAGLGVACVLGAVLAWSRVPAVRSSPTRRRLVGTLTIVAATALLTALSW